MNKSAGLFKVVKKVSDSPLEPNQAQRIAEETLGNQDWCQIDRQDEKIRGTPFYEYVNTLGQIGIRHLNIGRKIEKGKNSRWDWVNGVLMVGKPPQGTSVSVPYGDHIGSMEPGGQTYMATCAYAEFPIVGDVIIHMPKDTAGFKEDVLGVKAIEVVDSSPNSLNLSPGQALVSYFATVYEVELPPEALALIMTFRKRYIRTPSVHP